MTVKYTNTKKTIIADVLFGSFSVVVLAGMAWLCVSQQWRAMLWMLAVMLSFVAVVFVWVAVWQWLWRARARGWFWGNRPSGRWFSGLRVLVWITAPMVWMGGVWTLESILGPMPGPLWAERLGLLMATVLIAWLGWTRLGLFHFAAEEY